MDGSVVMDGSVIMANLAISVVMDGNGRSVSSCAAINLIICTCFIIK